MGGLASLGLSAGLIDSGWSACTSWSASGHTGNGDPSCAARTNGSPIDAPVTGGNGYLRAAGLPWS